MAVELVVLFLLFSPALWRLQLDCVKGKLYCECDAIILIFRWIDLVVKSAMPAITIVICNSVIVLTLYKRNKQKRSMSQTNEIASKGMTVLLFVISAWFVLSTVPFTIVMYLVDFYFTFESQGTLIAVTVLLCYSNNAMNFFLYCLSGSAFRTDLMNLFAHIKCVRCTGRQTSEISIETRETRNL